MKRYHISDESNAFRCRKFLECNIHTKRALDVKQLETYAPSVSRSKQHHQDVLITVQYGIAVCGWIRPICAHLRRTEILSIQKFTHIHFSNQDVYTKAHTASKDCILKYTSKIFSITHFICRSTAYSVYYQSTSSAELISAREKLSISFDSVEQAFSNITNPQGNSYQV